jgi:hypothetical protein
MVGPTGDAGTDGAPGSPGSDGATGATGGTGPAGPGIQTYESDTDTPVVNSIDGFVPGHSVILTLPSGSGALVMLDAEIQTSAGSEATCEMGIRVFAPAVLDLAPEVSHMLVMPQGGGSADHIMSGSANIRITGLTAGTYTFTPMYRTLGNATCTFSYGKALIIPQ